MEWLSSVLLTVQVISSLSIIVLVLLQQGKGSEMGAAFGSGSAGSLFGASGAANFLSRTTKWAAIVFFVSTAGLAYMAHHPKGAAVESGGVMQGFESSVPGVPNSGSAVPSVPSDVPAAPAQQPAPEADAAATETPAQTAPVSPAR